MKKSMKWLSIFGVILLVIGIVLYIAGVANGGKIDIASNQKHQMEHKNLKRYRSNEEIGEITNISIHTNTFDVVLNTSDDGKYHIEYDVIGSSAGNPVSYSIDDGKLTVLEGKTVEKPGIRVDFMDMLTGNDFRKSIPNRIVVKVPQGAALDDILGEIEYGDLTLREVKANNVNLTLNYGDLYLKGNEMDAITAKIIYGDMEMERCGWNRGNFILNHGDAEVELKETLPENMGILVKSNTDSIEIDEDLLEKLNCSFVDEGGKNIVRNNIKLEGAEKYFRLYANYGEVQID